MHLGSARWTGGISRRWRRACKFKHSDEATGESRAWQRSARSEHPLHSEAVVALELPKMLLSEDNLTVPEARRRAARAGRRYRFRIANPIPARFNGVAISICDLADGGLQIEHNDEFVRGSSGLIEYTIPGKTKRIRVHGTLVWTRKVDEEATVPVFRSGVKVEGHVDALNSTIDFFCARESPKSIEVGAREPRRPQRNHLFPRQPPPRSHRWWNPSGRTT